MDQTKENKVEETSNLKQLKAQLDLAVKEERYASAGVFKKQIMDLSGKENKVEETKEPENDQEMHNIKHESYM